MAAHSVTETKPERIEQLVSHILEEARMVLPGNQALLGFQLIAVFNQPFATMPPLHQYFHLLAICLSINSICFLMAPAALHRQSDPEAVTMDFARTATKFIFLGMIPLLFSIVIDAYVVIHFVTKNELLSSVLTLVLLCELVYCWIVMPQIKRHRLSSSVNSPQC